MIECIGTHKAKGGDGVNFDRTFWGLVAQEMASCTTIGAVKPADACSQKWGRLRSTFHVVDRVVRYSGIAWSTEHGADITPASEMVWADLVRVSTYYYSLLLITLLQYRHSPPPQGIID
ncbi:hypothetical protein DFJ58DRAFT_652380 [Suillus subalutaceus]|uniref:uncharacterized protein n=1 Tax=Suillus subalutaceus TaxID=48586 RepID=UPI001B86B7E3|nr:uncharacterized protein DFJ58DRAFT_652380 [Suillus subalutaceus]KAG1871815.1 hypothetical protein DFJ58DRAFT_652380 [Suillus subalutaceus]